MFVPDLQEDLEKKLPRLRKGGVVPKDSFTSAQSRTSGYPIALRGLQTLGSYYFYEHVAVELVVAIELHTMNIAGWEMK